MFYAYTKKYKNNGCFLKTKQTFTICIKKLHKTSKCLWPVYIDMFVAKYMFFFYIFINLFPKIHRSSLHNVTISLLYFWDVYDIIYEEKILTEARLIHVEQMSLYNFIILRKKKTPTRCFLVEFVKLSRTVVATSENT